MSLDDNQPDHNQSLSEQKFSFAKATDGRRTTTRDYYLFALKIMGDFGVAIAVPVLLLVLLGQYLGSIYGHKVIFTILAFLIAALATAKIIHKKAKKYGKEYQYLVDNDK